MSVPFIKTSFSAGEITPSLFGHVDLARFNLGASTCRNFFVSYRGGAYSRAGKKFVGFSKQTGRSVPPRVLTFQFSINQGLALEFGNLYMRVISNGAFVTEAPKNITGATQANPCVITSVGHGFSTGDWVFLSLLNGMTQLNGQIYVVTVLTADTFSLQDVYGNNINSTTFTAYTVGGVAARIFTLVTPWAEADLPWLKVTQSADVMSICCWNQDTGTSYPPYDLSRQANNSWTLTVVAPAPTVDPPTSCSGSASAAGTSDFQYVVTSVDPDTGTESIASPIGDIPNSVNIGSTLGSITVNWVPAANQNITKFNVYKATPVFNGSVAPGAIFGYAGTAFGTQFSDNNITPDFSQVPPTFNNPFAPGAIDSVNISAGGSGLSSVTWAVTTGTGSGFDGFPVVIGGVMTAFIVTKRGVKYLPGDSIAFNGAGFASGSILFAVNPVNNDTITLNGVVWTFKTTVAAAAQTAIKSTLALTLTQLIADLSASLDPALTVASYSQTGANTLVVRFLSAGVGGNAYTLAASVATPSGGTLTGGAGTVGSNPVGTLNVGPSTGTYPSLPAYFQQRRVYAATPNNPDTYFMSVPGSFTNFDKRDPTIDSDAIQGSPWSVQVNGIQFMVPMPGGLVTLTGLSAWQLTGAGGSSLNPQPITPANQQAQPQAYNGCHNHVPPIRISFDILYVQAKGSIVRDLNYNFFVNIYTGQDITVLSSHLFTGFQISEWAWAEEPFKVIWAVRDDGICLSLTFLKEQEINAWARSDTQGLYQSVCSVTEPPVDAIYFAVQRFTPAAAAANDNCYMIERMDDRIWNTIEDVWAVDAGLQLAQPTPAGTLTASSSTGLGALVGVTNLVGGSNYSASATATVVDRNGTGPGTGAVPVLTIVGGVITNITFAPAGAGYVFPTLTITDPGGTGSGATANPIVSNTMTFTTSPGLFSPGNVGSVIRSGGGCALITAYLSPTQVTANMRTPITQVIPNTGGSPIPQMSGNWTLTIPVTKLTGLNHLIGMSVTGLADGKVITPRIVQPDGSISLDVAASSITVGLGYQAQLQSVYLDTGAPTVQGQRKKISAVTARVELSQSFTVGSNQIDGSTLSPPQVEVRWTGMQPAPNPGGAPYLPQAPYPYIQAPALAAPTPLFTGDVRVPITGGYDKPGQVAVEQDNPLPIQVIAFIPEVLPGDTPSLRAPDEHRRAA